MTRLIFAIIAFIGFSATALGTAPGDIAFEREDKSVIEAFPEAKFPHWVHRMNYRCDACHDSIFEMGRSETPITMEIINKGEACGTCHNDQTAFGTGAAYCGKCHYSLSTD